jgi:hypothetical protein
MGKMRTGTVPDFRFLCEQGHQYEIHNFEQMRRKKLAEWSCPELPFPANDRFFIVIPCAFAPLRLCVNMLILSHLREMSLSAGAE